MSAISVVEPCSDYICPVCREGRADKTPGTKWYVHGGGGKMHPCDEICLREWCRHRGFKNCTVRCPSCNIEMDVSPLFPWTQKIVYLAKTFFRHGVVSAAGAVVSTVGAVVSTMDVAVGARGLGGAVARGLGGAVALVAGGAAGALVTGETIESGVTAGFLAGASCLSVGFSPSIVIATAGIVGGIVGGCLGLLRPR